MINNQTSKTLELILKNLYSTIANTKITVFLNNPNNTELASTDQATVNPNYISKPPSLTGYISGIESDLLSLLQESTNTLLILDINAISYITFETKSSIISPNKFSLIPSISSIEKALINYWYKECKLKLYGSNTTNPLSTIVSTEDIKYINKGVMWVEEYVVGRILNTVYSIDTLIGFSIINE